MKNYYILSNGRVKREQNTVFVEYADGTKKPLPVEDIDSLYLYGEIDLNTKLLTFLSQKHIVLHVFNYYGFYAGSYYPREFLNSGHLLVKQVSNYVDHTSRMAIATELVRASAHSMLRNLAYYERRKGDASTDADPPGEIIPDAVPSTAIPTDDNAEAAIDGSVDSSLSFSDIDLDADPLVATIDLDTEIAPLTALRQTVASLASAVGPQTDINELRGIEGKMRERYYQAWRHILSKDFLFERRVRRPPDNEINALISFGNSVLYTVCLSEIYRTQLTPTIAYLHEPGARRFSLALDISEVFKPLIVDRAIFRLVNTGQLDKKHFDTSLDGCYLTDAGKKLFLAALEERLGSTIRHRRLGRHVSYRHLIRLDCYRLIRHLTGIEPYRAFRAWW